MVPELVGTIIFMVIKPLSLFKLSCMAALRGILIVVNTWVELLSAAIYFNISMFWRFVFWTVSLITLPVRAVAALHREKQLEAYLSELQDRLDDFVWDRKELQEHIKMIIKEHEMIEVMLCELEDEHNQALHKIKLLETELRDLKDENLRLKEVHGKSDFDTSYGYPQRLKDTKISDIYAFEDKNKHNCVKKTDNEHQIIPGVLKKAYPNNNILGERRDVALSQSLFSTLLSLLVGMVIFEAGDTCMPLIMALFMVVGMSLKSVVNFFLTIKNKPASDAVALLSLNWFILGTLTYPMLPRVARLLSPFLVNLVEWALGRFLSFLVA